MKPASFVLPQLMKPDYVFVETKSIRFVRPVINKRLLSAKGANNTKECTKHIPENPFVPFMSSASW
jgi:hypothetical protein